jgi:hypothetical protein
MRSLLNSLLAAVCFTPIGVLCGLFVLSCTSPQTRGEGWGEFPLHAGAAFFLTSFVVWWALVARPGKPGVGRGAIAGLVSGLLAHPVTWYLLICVNWALALLNLRAGPSGGDDPLNPLTGLLGALVFSLGSLLLLGWVTIPAGALVGALVGAWQRRMASAG